jgi:hypothetical protein
MQQLQSEVHRPWHHALSRHAPTLRSLTLGLRLAADDDKKDYADELNRYTNDTESQRPETRLQFTELHTLVLEDTCYASGSCSFVDQWSAPNLQKCRLGMDLSSAAMFLENSGSPFLRLEELCIKAGGKEGNVLQAPLPKFAADTVKRFMSFLTKKSDAGVGLRILKLEHCTMGLLDAMYASRLVWTTRLVKLDLTFPGRYSWHCLRQALMLAPSTLVELHMRSIASKWVPPRQQLVEDFSLPSVVDRLEMLSLHNCLHSTLPALDNLRAPRLRQFSSKTNSPNDWSSVSSHSLWQFLSTPSCPMDSVELQMDAGVEAKVCHWLSAGIMEVPRVATRSFILLSFWDNIAGLVNVVHGRVDVEHLQRLTVSRCSFSDSDDNLAAPMLLNNAVYPHLEYADIRPSEMGIDNAYKYFAKQPALRRFNCCAPQCARRAGVIDVDDDEETKSPQLGFREQVILRSLKLQLSNEASMFPVAITRVGVCMPPTEHVDDEDIVVLTGQRGQEFLDNVVPDLIIERAL